MAVHAEDLLAFRRVDDVDERLLHRGDELRIVNIRVRLGDGDGVVVDARGHADDVQLIPDGIGAAHAGLAGLVGLAGGQSPSGLVIVAAVGVADDDVNRFGGSLSERVAIAGQRDDVRQIGDLLLVVILQPEGRINVAGGRRILQHSPVGLGEVIPGELLARVDLGGQLLAVSGRRGIDQGAIEGDLRAVLEGLVGFAVPGGRILAVVGQARAGSRQDDVHIVAEQRIGAARQPAQINGAGGHGLAGRLVVGADGDVDVLHVIALLEQRGFEQLRQVLGAGDDDVSVLGGDELKLEGAVDGNSVGQSGDGEDAHQHGQGKGQELFHS